MAFLLKPTNFWCLPVLAFTFGFGVSGCGEKFRATQEVFEVTQATQDPNADQENRSKRADTKDLKIEFLGGDFTPVTNTKSLREKQIYNFMVGADRIKDALVTWSLPKNQAGCNLRVFPGNAAATVECTADGEVEVYFSALFPDGKEEISSVKGFVKGSGLIPEVVARPINIPANYGLTVAGALAGFANSTNVNTQVVVYLGEVLRFRNNDSVDHKMAALNQGDPCELPDIVLKPTQSVDCTVEKETTYGLKFKDNLNTSQTGGGQVYLRSVDAAKVYQQFNCASCHASPKFDASFDSIRNAIATVPAMQTRYSLTGLPADPGDLIQDWQIRAIEHYLKN
jgi:hypothetical protein